MLATKPCNFIEQLSAAGGDHQIRPAAAEFERRRAPDPARSTGDNDVFSAQYQWQVYSID